MELGRKVGLKDRQSQYKLTDAVTGPPNQIAQKASKFSLTALIIRHHPDKRFLVEFSNYSSEQFNIPSFGEYETETELTVLYFHVWMEFEGQLHFES
jgi:hypothetical protein